MYVVFVRKSAFVQMSDFRKKYPQSNQLNVSKVLLEVTLRLLGPQNWPYGRFQLKAKIKQEGLLIALLVQSISLLTENIQGWAKAKAYREFFYRN